MSLSDAERQRFTPIIDSILVAADLQTISEKRIRKGLQTAIDYDLTEKKDAVKELIMVRFDIAMETSKNEAEPPKTNGHLIKPESPTPPSTANHETSASPVPSKKHKQEDLSDSLSSVVDSPKPKKKRKIENQDSDAAYAAKLQAMENQRSRSTRGGGAKSSKPVKKKTPKKKSSNKIRAEDDSDLDGSGSGAEGKERKVNRNTNFHKEQMLSSALSALLDNEVKLSRPQTVKRIWMYVREHNLQDPKDKRMIRCDDAMRAVFKQDKIHMFTMNKILNQNLYPADE